MSRPYTSVAKTDPELSDPDATFLLRRCLVDQEAVNYLAKARIDVSMKKHLPVVPIVLDQDEKLVLPGEEIPVLVGGKYAVSVKLKPISALFTGTVRPPSFAHSAPPAQYFPFIAMIERTAIDYCRVMRQIVKDQEFNRLYTHLRRRPDGTDANPLFAYLQAATRLYMSLRDVSRDEFEAVAGRLALSAKHFSIGYSSTNYFEVVSRDHALDAAEVEVGR
jgi:hypothetical protein